jgi:hypothetical protein
VNFNAVRKIALSLPDTSEAPHFKYTSFRVSGKIFATAPPDEATVNIFVDERVRDLAMARAPEYTQKLFWGGKAVGVTVVLADAKSAIVRSLLEEAWRRKKPAAKAAAAQRKPRHTAE